MARTKPVYKLFDGLKGIRMLTLWLAFACVLGGQQPPESEWTGFVRDQSNRAASAAVVELRGSGYHFSQAAGENGGFHFIDLPPGTYQLTVTYNGRSFHSEQTISVPISGIAQLMLTAEGSISMQSSERAQAAAIQR